MKPNCTAISVYIYSSLANKLAIFVYIYSLLANKLIIKPRQAAAAKSRTDPERSVCLIAYDL